MVEAQVKAVPYGKGWVSGLHESLGLFFGSENRHAYWLRCMDNPRSCTGAALSKCPCFAIL